ncbi:MAG: NAD(P)H-dependent oxidoreductase [Campylobacterales bacterium]|nr:NAD(P)H-dependent oxidoreductase [Campylobacterales bacterium]
MNPKTQFLDAMQFRHACKLFNDQKISKEDLRFILEAGRVSPSSFGVEQWKFLVVQNEALKKEIEAASWGQKQISTSSDLIVILARKDVRSSDVYTRAQLRRFGLAEEAFNGFMEIYKAWIDGRDDQSLELWSEKQCYIAAANMMSAAAFIGIDSCPIEGFDAAKINAMLGIDTAVFHTALLIPFGYRASEQRAKHRLSFDEVVEFRA